MCYDSRTRESSEGVNVATDCTPVSSDQLSDSRDMGDADLFFLSRLGKFDGEIFAFW